MTIVSRRQTWAVAEALSRPYATLTRDHRMDRTACAIPTGPAPWISHDHSGRTVKCEVDWPA